ncbi:flagellar biosynthesis repressor FlbT [Methylobacterium sp. WL120]|uniref:flagellar biosynthesis repressor FlbT n=1 Tax=Methylobacterium sp. WL120 TaxID=2603887 RepID=UPI0011C8AB81|nr:flagellar biosynthesis repressor FlbT [Methylobacterium sp. WL120]TXM64664.1 flagellar protein FlbT [Methylobacterium sp. WL120]
MPLKLTLKPNERLIINGASIRNGDRSSTIIMETKCKFLREREIMHESDANTAAKMICVTLQIIYLNDNPSEAMELFYRQAADMMAGALSTAPYILAIQQELEAQRYHAAIKKGRELIAYERKMLDHASSAASAATAA